MSRSGDQEGRMSFVGLSERGNSSERLGRKDERIHCVKGEGEKMIVLPLVSTMCFEMIIL